MNDLLVHGVFDQAGLTFVQSHGVDHVGFDLRGHSGAMVTFASLRSLKLQGLKQKILVFQDEAPATVLAALDLLKDLGTDFTAEFRGVNNEDFLESFEHDFYWMFSPIADWRRVLRAPYLRALLLPLEWQREYQQLPEIWEAVEARKLRVFLHAKDFTEALGLKNNKGIDLSFDLPIEVHHGARVINQGCLYHSTFWRREE